MVHISLNMRSKDVISVFLRIPWLSGFALFHNLSFLSFLFYCLLQMVTRESLVVVRYIDTAIDCSFHSTKDSVACGGSDETNIQVCFEWSLFYFLCHDIKEFSIGVLDSLELIVQFQVVQKTSGNQQSCSVWCCIVCQSCCQSELSKFIGVGLA